MVGGSLGGSSEVGIASFSTEGGTGLGSRVATTTPRDCVGPLVQAARAYTKIMPGIIRRIIRSLSSLHCAFPV